MALLALKQNGTAKANSYNDPGAKQALKQLAEVVFASSAAAIFL